MTARSDLPTPPFFDEAKGLEALGSDESLRMILETVVENLSASLPDIQTALERGDAATANSLLHSIKGYAPLFACDPLIEQVIHVEGVSKTATAEVIQPLYSALAPALHQLLSEVQAYMQQSPREP